MGQEPFWPDLSVQISRRRWRCVPDPALCLTGHGAAFVSGLASHAEVWMTPEFHHILDSWLLYDQSPELLAQSLGGQQSSEEIRHALRVWLRMRDESGQAATQLCWVRDALRESRLPTGMDESIVPRWESVAEALDQRLAHSTRADGPGVAAMRDVAALTAVLPGALLLSYREPAEPDQPPSFCRHLEAWRLPCSRLDIDDDLVAVERSLLLRLLVEAGVASFLWGGLGLAVVHLVTPSRGFTGTTDEFELFAEAEPLPSKGAWEGAQAFWYDVAARSVHVGSWPN